MPFLWRKRKRPETFDQDIRVVCEQREAECRVSLSGRITIESSPGLYAFLLERLKSPVCRILTVDFCEVVYLDTSGLAMLVEILKAARRLGKTFQVSGLRERPRFLLEASRLLRLFHEVPAGCSGGTGA